MASNCFNLITMTFKHYLLLILSIYTNIIEAQDLKIIVRAIANDALFLQCIFLKTTLRFALANRETL
jgi:hypothetical protein